MEFLNSDLFQLTLKLGSSMAEMNRTETLATLAIVVEKLTQAPSRLVLVIAEHCIVRFLRIVRDRDFEELFYIYQFDSMFQIDIECFILLQFISFSQRIKTKSPGIYSDFIEVVAELAYQHKLIQLHYAPNRVCLKEDFIRHTTYLVKPLENRGRVPHLEIRDSSIYGKVQKIVSNMDSKRESAVCAMCKRSIVTEFDVAILPDCDHFYCQACVFQFVMFSRNHDPICATCNVEIRQWTFRTILQREKKTDFRDRSELTTTTPPNDNRPVIRGYWRHAWQHVKRRTYDITPVIYINLGLHILSNVRPSKFPHLLIVVKLLARTSTKILKGLLEHRCTAVEVALANELVDGINKRRDYCAKFKTYTKIVFYSKQVKSFYEILLKKKKSS